MDENSPAGANVGQPVTAKDPDGDTITYSLSGTGSEFFDIKSSGQITVGQGTNLDHETTPQYSITVHADDGQGGTDRVDIIVNVKDVDEPSSAGSAGGASQLDEPAPANSPPQLIHAVKRGVFENSPAGTNVGKPVTATDPDGDTIAYSLSGTGSELFDIDGSGQITVGQGTNLDHETTPQYFITVHAANGNHGTDSVAITVNVKDVDEPLSTVSVSGAGGGTEAGDVFFFLRREGDTEQPLTVNVSLSETGAMLAARQPPMWSWPWRTTPWTNRTAW